MLKNPFAHHAGGIVHVDDAASLEAPFSCPGCGQEMTLTTKSRPYTRKNSSKTIRNRSHFVHTQRDHCSTALETALHQWGKLIIEEAIQRGDQPTIPAHTVKDILGELVYTDTYEFTSVELEVWQEGVRPDLVLRHASGSLNVEIRVSHAVDERKATGLQAKNASCIEIDLRDFDFDRTPGDELRKAILHDAPREWISHAMLAERLADLKARETEWIASEGRRVHAAVLDTRSMVKADTKGKFEQEMLEWGTAAFIGRETAGQMWFNAAPRHWQHSLLMHRVIHAVQRGDWTKPLPLYPVESNMRTSSYPFQKKELHLDEPDEFIIAAGFKPSALFRSPLYAHAEYLSMLCSEQPDVKAHPAVSHLLAHGPQPGLMTINPVWASYNHRKNRELKMAFEWATRVLVKQPPDYLRWLSQPLDIPLTGKQRTPRAICLEGGVDFCRLLAHLSAIRNMLDGGWPVRNLLGLDLRWLRDRERKRYDAPLPQGGCNAAGLQGIYYTCPSFMMMRKGMRGRDILPALAALVLPEDRASAFIQTEREELSGATPVEFAIDIPTMQRCIDLLPKPPGANGRRRQW